MAAVSTKNLFLRDKHGALYLVVTACEKRLDLKGLSLQLSAPKLHFASEETLRERLGLGRGSVTVLGLINDADHRVQLWIDREIWDQDTFLCHPLVNTATLVLSRASLQRFFDISGHIVHLLELEHIDESEPTR